MTTELRAKLDYAGTKALLEEIAKDHPDRINIDSRYFDPNTGQRCIAGEFFYRLGVTDEELRNLDEDMVGSVIEFNVEDFLDISLTPRAVRLLSDAQAYQDQRKSWHDAVETALHESPPYKHDEWV